MKPEIFMYCMVLVALILFGAHHAEQAKPVKIFEAPATERVRLILEASGLSNKEAYLLLGDAIHEHVSVVCPDQGIEP